MDNAVRVGLAVERLVAVDAQDESQSETINTFRGGDSALSKAEVGCFLSHRKAWQFLLSSEASFLAVFEDDTHLSEDLVQILQTEIFFSGSDLIKLEVPSGKVSYDRTPKAQLPGRNLHRLLSRAYGAGAYILSRRCAEYLLNITESCNQPVDVILFDDIQPVFKSFGVFQIIPAPCIQDINLNKNTPAETLFTSSIEGGRQETKDARKSRDKKKGKRVRFKKFKQYIYCVWHGAHPLNYKDYIPVDLGTPGHS